MAAGRKVGGMGFGNVVVVLCGGIVKLGNLAWRATKSHA